MARLGKGLMVGIGLGLGVLGFGAQQASALPNFQANECNVAGTGALGGIPIGTCFITADRFNHQFVSSGTQTFGGPDLTGADDPFTEVGSARVTGIQLGAGVGASAWINATLGLGVVAPQYGMYALFSGSGESDFLGASKTGSTGIQGNFSDFKVEIWLDPHTDSDSQSTPGSVGGSTGDDVLLATGTLAPASLCPLDPSCGIARVFEGLNAGSLAVLVEFTLNPAQNYFTAPDPFYALMKFTGVSTLVTPINATTTETFGSGDGFFVAEAVPVPASLALLGLGLVGMAVGATRRRR